MLKKHKIFAILLAVFVLGVLPNLALDITISGTINEYTSPYVEYPIQVEAGELIEIAVNCVGDSLDTYLLVFGPGGFYREDDDGGSDTWECTASGSNYSSALSFRAPTSGVYSIVVTSYNIFNNYRDDDTTNGNYTLIISGNYTPLFDYNADGRLNHGYGDLYAVLYRSTDDAGEPAIDVYCDTGAQSWTVTLHVTAGSGNATANGCNVAVYALEGGAYQFNITTPEAKLYTVICNDLACEGRESSYFDPHE